MARYEKDCDGMARDELEKRFVALQKIASTAEQGLFALLNSSDDKVRLALADYNAALLSYETLESELEQS